MKATTNGRAKIVLPLQIFAIFILLGAGCAPESVSVPVEPQKESVNSNVETKNVSSVPNNMNKTQRTNPGILPATEIQKKQIHMKTTKGDIVFELFPDTAPKAVSNFVALAKDGFYNDLKFHRREEGFVIQGGDPLGNGMGNPGYRFEDELKDSYKYDRGIVAMANSGPNTNGSQFFIMLADYPLPKKYTIFGRVLRGMEAVDAIKVGDVMTSVMVEPLGTK